MTQDRTQTPNPVSRRSFALGLAATPLALSACASGGLAPSSPQTIDARVDSAIGQLFRERPEARDLASRAAGMLIMPLVTEAGFGLGGAYGRGALRIGGHTADYYSVAKASSGVQIGAQQYSHALLFMTQSALDTFRNSPGYALGANAQIVLPEDGGTIAAETTTALAPTIAIIFGQSGIRAGAMLEGVKYTRINP